MSTKKLLIYGGKGALGQALVNYFKQKQFWIASVDFLNNEDADLNIVLKQNIGVEEQATLVGAGIPDDTELDGIICVAGGWAGGNAGSQDFLKNSNLMLEQSVWSSLIATNLAAKLLKSDGLLVLTGAQPALNPTPGMIGYGMAKAAVHHLIKSLGEPKSGLPAGAKAYGILPVTLDTPMNRKWMKPDGTWTPLEDVAGIINDWLEKDDLPPSGSLVQIITKDGNTSKVLS